MEKLTYLPLIHHLQEKADLYNSLYQESQLKYGSVNKSALTYWIVEVVEPIVKGAAEKNKDSLPSVFKACYTELLALLGSQLGLVHEQEYQLAWLLLSNAPHLAAMAPVRILKALNSALVSIRTYQPEKIFYWIDLMDNIARHCQTVDEFLLCGRINGWFCGLAHLKAKALESFSLLHPDLQTTLQANTSVPIQQASVKSPWIGISDSKKPEFMGEAGGFIGFGGPFLAPPQVAIVGNHIVATDKRSTCALFADSFGKVLLSDISVSPQEVSSWATNTAFDAFKARYSRKIIDFEDISSSVEQDSTFVLTRHSSHYLFIYGWA